MSDQLDPAFAAVFFRRGSLTARCGLCGTVHFCVDDPDNPHEVVEAGQGLSVNDSYGPNELERLLVNFDLSMGFQPGNSLIRYLGMTAKEAEALAEHLIDTRPGDRTEARVGESSVFWGIWGGKAAVDGCCTERICGIQEAIWSGREWIADYFSRMADEAEQIVISERKLAEKAARVFDMVDSGDSGE